jgi:hypothetical protein
MKKIVKGMALFLACLQMTVCIGCGSSGGSGKKSSSKGKGFDTPEDAIEAYLQAAVDEDEDAIYNMFYEGEIDIYIDMIEEMYDEKTTKSEFKSLVIEQLEEELEDFQEDLSYYPLKEWKMNYENREDITDEFLNYDDDENQEFNEKLRKKYDDMNLKKVYMYDSVGMIHEETDDFAEFLEDDIACLQFDDKWYIMMYVDI